LLRIRGDNSWKSTPHLAYIRFESNIRGKIHKKACEKNNVSQRPYKYSRILQENLVYSMYNL